MRCGLEGEAVVSYVMCIKSTVTPGVPERLGESLLHKVPLTPLHQDVEEKS